MPPLLKATWKHPIFLWVCLLGVLLWSSPGLAAEGGYSNYIPGTYGDFGVAITPEPGFYAQNYLYYYSADASRAVRQGQIEFNVDLEIAMEFPILFYVTDLELLGGRYAFGGGIPLVYLDVSADLRAGPFQRSFSEDRLGIGDAYVIPVSLYWSFGDLSLNVYQGIVAPTGSYDVDREANTGLNYWSFDTNLAFTYLHPEFGTELSFNVGHIYNTENPDTNYQTGKEFHLDYMLNQFFSETFAIGFHGFYYKQYTGDSGSSAVLGDFKAQAAGIGPAVLWIPTILGTEVGLVVKWFHEFEVENRLEGDHVLVVLGLGF
ncbi:MAG TPA: transporter [Anaerolineae bacterium]|nr:transporter [Anaerolineae bacterium]